MGSSGSKAAGAAVRRYPTRIPPMANQPPSAPRPPHHNGQVDQGAQQQQETGNSPAIDKTSPEFSARLKTMGMVDPSQSQMPSSSHPASTVFPIAHPSRSPTLTALEVRRRIQESLETDHDGNSARAGYLDAATLRRMIALRDRGSSPAEIEQTLGLKPGAAETLGRPGVFSSV